MKGKLDSKNLLSQIKQMQVKEGKKERGGRSNGVTERYWQWYGGNYEESLLKEELPAEGLLKKTQVSEYLRAKMVDWMLEVFGNYENTSSNNTYFRAVGLMDQFLLRALRPLKNEDLHLVGIACLFLASKQEDVYHISLEDVFNKVGHRRFSPTQIKEAEFEVLQALSFKTTFPTSLQFLSVLVHRCSPLASPRVLAAVLHTALFVLKLVNYDLSLASLKPSLLASSVLLYAVKTIFLELQDKSQKEEEEQDWQGQEQKMIQSILGRSETKEVQAMDETIRKIKGAVNCFEKTFPNLKNLNTYMLH